MKPTSVKRAKDYAPRRAAETLLGRDSDGNGVCARCGRFGYVNGHEVVPRGVAGGHKEPDALLCPPCNGLVGSQTIEESGGLKKSRASKRHEFTGDDIGFLCAVCGQPDGGWRHR